MATIVFADHRLIFHFMENCEYDINKLGCGRFPRGQNEAAVPDSVCLLLSTVCGVYSQELVLIVEHPAHLIHPHISLI